MPHPPVSPLSSIDNFGEPIAFRKQLPMESEVIKASCSAYLAHIMSWPNQCDCQFGPGKAVQTRLNEAYLRKYDMVAFGPPR